MKNIDKLKLTLKGFTSTINRYPITILLFLFSAIFTSYHISTNNLNNIGEILLSLALVRPYLWYYRQCLNVLSR